MTCFGGIVKEVEKEWVYISALAFHSLGG
jgi:hypothetical protein